MYVCTNTYVALFTYSCACVSLCVYILILCDVQMYNTTCIYLYSQESVQFYNSKGLGDLPQMLMNGVQIDTEEVCRMGPLNNKHFDTGSLLCLVVVHLKR